jgi:hypothetical protein
VSGRARLRADLLLGLAAFALAAAAGCGAQGAPAAGSDAAAGADAAPMPDAAPADADRLTDTAVTADAAVTDARGDARTADGAADARPPTDGAIAGDPNAPALPTCLDWGATTPAALEAALRRLTGEVPVTVGGAQVTIRERFTAAGRASARALLRADYEAMGYTVSDLPYGAGTGVNLRAARAGSSGGGDVFIVGGHYDTVADVAGADDNASGVVATLAIGRALRGCALGRSLHLLAFDEEERGAIGSRAYAGALRDAGEAARVYGMINLDMLGYDANDDGRALLVDCDRAESAFITDTLLRRERAMGLGISVVRPCRMGGDWRSFWDARIPAITFGEEFFVPDADSNPCYHRACDRIDRMHLPYYARLVTLTAATVAELVQAH